MLRPPYGLYCRRQHCSVQMKALIKLSLHSVHWGNHSWHQCSSDIHIKSLIFLLLCLCFLLFNVSSFGKRDIEQRVWPLPLVTFLLAPLPSAPYLFLYLFTRSLLVTLSKSIHPELLPHSRHSFVVTFCQFLLSSVLSNTSCLDTWAHQFFQPKSHLMKER